MTGPRQLARSCLSIKLEGDATGLWPTRARDLARALLDALDREDNLVRHADARMRDIARLNRRAEQAEARIAELEARLRGIAETARWYADNGQCLPLEVNHALCVEVLSCAEDALS